MQAAIEGVPELRGWWEETRELGSSLHSQSIDLAYELLDNRPGELISLLRKLSAGIDLLLDHHDDHDEISLGFLEVLVAESAERGLDRRFVTAIAAMVLAEVVIYACGLAWLSHFVPAGSLLKMGLLPFIPGDALKILAAAAVLPTGWGLLSRTVGKKI